MTFQPGFSKFKTNEIRGRCFSSCFGEFFEMIFVIKLRPFNYFVFHFFERCLAVQENVIKSYIAVVIQEFCHQCIPYLFRDDCATNQGVSNISNPLVWKYFSVFPCFKVKKFLVHKAIVL